MLKAVLNKMSTHFAQMGMCRKIFIVFFALATLCFIFLPCVNSSEATFWLILACPILLFLILNKGWFLRLLVSLLYGILLLLIKDNFGFVEIWWFILLCVLLHILYAIIDKPKFAAFFKSATKKIEITVSGFILVLFISLFAWIVCDFFTFLNKGDWGTLAEMQFNSIYKPLLALIILSIYNSFKKK